jgi:hypothetical protein
MNLRFVARASAVAAVASVATMEASSVFEETEA